MNRILKPCRKLEIDGVEYAVNTGFDVWIEIGGILLEKEGVSVKNIARMLALAYPVLPENPIKAVEGILWFYSGGVEKQANEETVGFQAPLIDVKRDFKYIWAAFLSEFGLDLSENPLHWWKFLALLTALGENSCFSRIVSYRSIDTSHIKNRDTRMFYEKMKKKYRLPDLRSDDEREMDTILKLGMLF